MACGERREIGQLKQVSFRAAGCVERCDPKGDVTIPQGEWRYSGRKKRWNEVGQRAHRDDPAQYGANRTEWRSSEWNGLDEGLSVILKKVAGSVDLQAATWKQEVAGSERKALSKYRLRTEQRCW